jgi:hypothetical protein
VAGTLGENDPTVVLAESGVQESTTGPDERAVSYPLPTALWALLMDS